MADYAPGPLTPAVMPLAPRVMRPDTFQSLGATMVETLGGLDVALGGVTNTVAPLAGVELGPQFERDVAPAEAAIGAIGGGDSDGVIDTVLGAIDQVAGDVASQLLDLPNPDGTEPDIDAPPGAIPPGEGKDETGPKVTAPDTPKETTGPGDDTPAPTDTPPADAPTGPVDQPTGGSGGGGDDRPGRGDQPDRRGDGGR